MLTFNHIFLPCSHSTHSTTHKIRSCQVHSLLILWWCTTISFTVFNPSLQSTQHQGLQDFSKSKLKKWIILLALLLYKYALRESKVLNWSGRTNYLEDHWPEHDLWHCQRLWSLLCTIFLTKRLLPQEVLHQHNYSTTLSSATTIQHPKQPR